jgi:hypothetical protein
MNYFKLKLRKRIIYGTVNIMKKVLLLIVFISAYSILFAQKQQYKLVEGELGISMPFGMRKIYGEQTIDRYPGLYGELRFNIPNRHLSIGNQVYITSWEVTGYEMYKTRYSTTVLFNTIFDYNFNEIKGFILPFAGAGIGMANINDYAKLYISSRIGLEFWNRARFSIGYNLTNIAGSSFVCKLGFVVGGGKQK